MITAITIIHVIVCVFLVLIVLVQQGRGADAGAAFGGGGQTFFGASGADNFLTRLTTFTAIGFMLTSIALAVNMKQQQVDGGAIIEELPASEAVPMIPSASTSSAPLTAEGADKEGVSKEGANKDTDKPNELAAGQPAGKQAAGKQAAGAQAVGAVAPAPNVGTQAPVAPEQEQTGKP